MDTIVAVERIAVKRGVRELACIPFRDRRVPDSPGEVVAKADGTLITVSVRRTVGRGPEILSQEFEYARHEDCLRAVRAWLHCVAMPESPEADTVVHAWADTVARRVLAAMA
ncbi:MAG TPA: hypothetical protein VFL14_05110 [Xanthomonadales bacterium]|nr:hypothetical protein [Xanthomonadales bacterium]